MKKNLYHATAPPALLGEEGASGAGRATLQIAFWNGKYVPVCHTETLLVRTRKTSTGKFSNSSVGKKRFSTWARKNSSEESNETSEE